MADRVDPAVTGEEVTLLLATAPGPEVVPDLLRIVGARRAVPLKIVDAQQDMGLDEREGRAHVAEPLRQGHAVGPGVSVENGRVVSDERQVRESPDESHQVSLLLIGQGRALDPGPGGRRVTSGGEV